MSVRQIWVASGRALEYLILRMNAHVGGRRPQDVAGLNIAASAAAASTATASTPKMSSGHLHRAEPLSLFGVKALDLGALDGGTGTWKNAHVNVREFGP